MNITGEKQSIHELHQISKIQCKILTQRQNNPYLFENQQSNPAYTLKLRFLKGGILQKKDYKRNASKKIAP